MKAPSLIVSLALGLASSPAAIAATDYHQRQPASATGTVDVSNVAGSIKLVGWERDEVEVEGRVGDGVERVEFTVDGDRTTLRVHLPRGRGNVRDADAELTLRVPHASRVQVSTVSADIEAEGLSGRPELQSVSGDITAAGGFSRVDLQSVSGSVRLTGAASGVRARAVAVSGDVLVDGIDGDLDATSVSGGVRVTGHGLRRADLSSTSGDVVYDAPLVAGGQYRLSTVSGSARLTVHGAVKAGYRLETSAGGSIRNGFGPRARRSSEYGPGMSLEFSEGDEAEVRMSSVSGSLRLERR